jgi:polyisoprenoid-binding protein YceI
MKRVILSLCTIVFVITAGGAQTVWKLDKTHSNVDFTVTHFVISEVRGTFKEFEATLASEKPDFSDMQVEATIKTASIFTDNEKRDAHLRSNDFLNTEKYPDIKFKSTSVNNTGNDTFEIAGDLTIRDVTKPVVLHTTFKGTIDAFGGTRAAFKATTTIDRFEFGTTWDKTIESGGRIVGKDVNITLLLEFVKEKKS